MIIMTSNVGAELLSKGPSLGFDTGVSAAIKESDRLLSVAKKYFKPEFLNRVDDVVVFRKLEREDLLSIIKLETDAVAQRLQKRGIKLECGSEVLNFLLEKGFEPEYGARPLRRAVERYLEDPLAEELLRGELPENTVIKTTISNNAICFQQQPVKKTRIRKRKTTPKE